MGLGLVDRVKKTLNRHQQAPAPRGETRPKSEVLGQMTFEQATSSLAPDGAMDRQRRPAPVPSDNNNNNHPAAQKKQPDAQGAIAIAQSVVQAKAAEAAVKKGGPPPRSIYMNGVAPGVKASGAKTSAQVPPSVPASVYMTSDALAKAPPPTYMTANPSTNTNAPALGAPASPYSSMNDLAPASQLGAQPEDNDYCNDPIVLAATRAPRVQAQRDDMDSGADAELVELVPEEEQQAIVEAAVRMPPPQALSAKDLETLRKAAQPNTVDSRRVGLTSDEQQTEGYALLPILTSQRNIDEMGGDHGFKTHYHYNDMADLQRNKGGYEQTLGRQEFVVELRDGKFVYAKSGEALESSNLHVPGFLVANAMKERRTKLGRDLDADEKKQLGEELTAAGGRYIFVMDASGNIYAGENIHAVQHHSSFLGGGAIAAAGELMVSGGQLQLVSNQSGHYQPGPGYLWQAMVQMQSQGVSMGGVTADILGVGTMDAEDFMTVFQPTLDPALMRADYATTFLKRYLKGDEKPRGGPEAPVVPTGPEGKKEVGHA